MGCSPESFAALVEAQSGGANQQGVKASKVEGVSLNGSTSNATVAAPTTSNVEAN
jgi:hypothetical protein